MLKLNQICKLNEDTMASYECQLTKEKVKKTNVFSLEKSNLRYAGKKSIMGNFTQVIELRWKTP